MYRYKGGEVENKSKKSNFLSKLFTFDASICFEALYSLLICISLYVIDIESLFFKPNALPLIAVIGALVITPILYFVIDFVSKCNSKDPIYSDRLVFSGFIGVLAYFPMVFIEHSLRKTIAVAVVAALVCLYIALRFAIYKLIKTNKVSSMPFIRQFEEDKTTAYRVSCYIIATFAILVSIISFITSKSWILSLVSAAVVAAVYALFVVLKKDEVKNFVGCLLGFAGVILMSAIVMNIPLLCCSCLLMVSTIVIHFLGGKK